MRESHMPTVTNEIFKFSPSLDTFCHINYLLDSLETTTITQFKNDAFGLYFRV